MNKILSHRLHLASAEDPPALTSGQWLLCYAIGIIIGMLALSKLIVYPQYAQTLINRHIPAAPYIGALIIFIELFSLPVLFKQRLSPLFRAFSAVALVLTSIIWLAISIQLGAVTHSYNYGVIIGNVVFVVWTGYMFNMLRKSAVPKRIKK